MYYFTFKTFRYTFLIKSYTSWQLLAIHWDLHSLRLYLTRVYIISEKNLPIFFKMLHDHISLIQWSLNWMRLLYCFPIFWDRSARCVKLVTNRRIIVNIRIIDLFQLFYLVIISVIIFHQGSVGFSFYPLFACGWSPFRCTCGGWGLIWRDRRGTW